MKPILLSVIVAALPFASAPLASAQTPGGQQVAPVPAQYTNGEVLEVNLKDATVVLQHEFIQNLGMDPMAMEFEVNDQAMLTLLKRGDKVRFKAVYRDRKYILIEVQPRK